MHQYNTCFKIFQIMAVIGNSCMTLYKVLCNVMAEEWLKILCNFSLNCKHVKDTFCSSLTIGYLKIKLNICKVYICNS